MLSVTLPSTFTNMKRVLQLISKSTIGLMRKLQMSTDASLGPCDLALVYNYSATTPTGAIPSVSAASASIGRGVAIIHIHADTTAQKVQQVQQQEKEKINKMKWPHIWSEDLVVIKDEDEDKNNEKYETNETNTKNEIHTTNETNETNETGTKLKVKVWTAGRINVSVLIDRFEVHVQRAVHQYALETHYWKRPIQKCLDNLQSTWMEPITSVMDSALALGAANV